MSAYSIATRGLAGRKIPQGVLAPINTLLFGSSEQGAWYDPADLSTLFQDTAGTTPVTAVEQAVALMLDKSGRGNHASQATSTKRPKYSRRVNLLPSNDLGAWIKTAGAMMSVASVGDVHTGSNVFKLTYDGSGGAGSYRAYVDTLPRIVSAPNATYSTSIYLRADVPFTARISGNAVAGLVTTVNVTTAWQKVSITGVGNGVGEPQALIYSAAGDNAPFELYISSTDIRLATDSHLPYQRVNTATNYDTAGFPYYLRFDGIDDAIVTGNIDFTGTDKMTVWAGVTPNSVAANAMLLELSDISNTNDGSFKLLVPETYGDPSVSSTSRGTAANASNQGAFSTTINNASPLVISTAHDISGDRTTLSINGAPLSPAIGDKGAGDFGNYPLYIGARAGTSLFFNGRLYSLIVRGAESSLSQIEAVENLIRKTMRLP